MQAVNGGLAARSKSLKASRAGQSAAKVSVTSRHSTMKRKRPSSEKISSGERCKGGGEMVCEMKSYFIGGGVVINIKEMGIIKMREVASSALS
jgi:hypothetical protein